jgi:two-component system, NtrC family, nitrogen regulation response regulator GlnG
MTNRIWIIDDDSSIRWVLGRALSQQQYEIESFESADNALRKLTKSSAPEVIITDIRMPGMSGLELLDHLTANWPEIPVILMTAHSDLDSAVSAYKGGAFEYLPKPFDVDDAVGLVQKALQHNATDSGGGEPVRTVSGNSAMIGEAPAMQEVFRIIGRLSKSNMSVLIRGESGTGKELVAQALYRTSSRASGPFVAINTAAIPAELLESELFGHEKGAFTGAAGQRTGRFEQAQGGSLFLDEIGDMPADLQTRLLRVLSNNSFYRVGGHKEIKSDVRIIAATNQDLEARVADGRFREDLYHRLNVISIQLPALRERREDIAKLCVRFLERAAVELEVEQKVLSSDAIRAMRAFDWPGNVRQLENVCRRLTVMAPGQVISPMDLPVELLTPSSQSELEAGDWRSSVAQIAAKRFMLSENGILNDMLPDFEKVLINTALEHTKGHKQAAAKLLGWGRNTLTRKLKELQIE